LLGPERNRQDLVRPLIIYLLPFHFERIRPGRIDKVIKLGYIQSNEAIEMAQHYLQATMTDAQRNRMRNVLESQVRQCG